jgi:transposase
MSYSLDLREKALLFLAESTQVETARIFQVGLSTLKRWLKRPKLQALKTGAKTPKKLPLEKLQQALDETPDATLAEYAEILGVTPQAVFYACKRNKLTRKKNHALPRAK